MNSSNFSKDERDLSKIVASASGLGLGAMLAFSQALRIRDGTFSVQFSVATVIAFALGFTVAFVYLSRILRCLKQTSRLFVRGGFGVIILLGIAAFIYPFRFGIDALVERLGGLAVALCFIASGLTLVRLIVHGAEREEAEQEAKERAASNGAAPRV